MIADFRARIARLGDSQDPHWQRPGPTREQMRHDVAVTGAFIGVALLSNMAALSGGLINVPDTDQASWHSYAALTVMILPLAFRRRYPLLTVTVSSALFISMSYFAPDATPQLAFQIAYFAALYTAVAWARDRRMLWVAVGLVLLTMALWVGVLITQLHAQDIVGQTASRGPLPRSVGVALYNVLSNLAYFGGAVLIGQMSWRAALQRDRSAQQAATIAAQADDLARNAVLDERMRIARELHDVVAHHVSAIGVQAAAARTTNDSAAATGAIQEIEKTSRQAVGDMRELLGVLRNDSAADASDRSPDPGLDQVDELADEYRRSGLAVSLNVIEHRPSDLSRIGAALELTVYRVIQESLANVRRHSTARQAQVSIRTGTVEPGSDAEWLEIEVVDDGRPRTATHGTGNGLRGIRERVTFHRGWYDAGPRLSPGAEGWRVRARIPLRDNE